MQSIGESELMGHSINTDKPAGKPPTITQSSMRDMRLDLRWGLIYKGKIIMAFISQKRARSIMDLAQRDTPERDEIVLKDFAAKDSS